MPIPHPFHPMTSDEIERAVVIFRAHHNDEHAFFSSVGLIEPEKSVVQTFSTGDDVIRKIRLLGIDSQDDGGFEADINVTTGGFALKRLTGHAQAPYGFADLGLAVKLTKAHEGWLDAVRARDIKVDSEEDLELVQVDPWPAGGYAHPSLPDGHRGLRCIAFVKSDATDNGYARPIHGLIAHVDLTSGQVIDVENVAKEALAGEQSAGSIFLGDIVLSRKEVMLLGKGDQRVLGRDEALLKLGQISGRLTVRGQILVCRLLELERNLRAGQLSLD